MQRDLIALPGKEVVVSRIVQAPGASGRRHRHFAQVFVYVLQGKVVMQVKGGSRMTLGPGQTFYENPSDTRRVRQREQNRTGGFSCALNQGQGQASNRPGHAGATTVSRAKLRAALPVLQPRAYSKLWARPWPHSSACQLSRQFSVLRRLSSPRASSRQRCSHPPSIRAEAPKFFRFIISRSPGRGRARS
jgi:mannose-6-phosphate isomerase-like protein (cupin superfamily)